MIESSNAPAHGSTRLLGRLIGALVSAVGLTTSPGSTIADYELLPNGDLSWTTVENPLIYYVLQTSSDLLSFAAGGIDFGANAPVWEVDLDPTLQPRSFSRIQAVSLFSPLDTDGDFIDDVYELNRPGILNPLDPSDANLDPDGNGLTHLEEYLRALFDINGPPQVYSREVTAFNFGLPREAALSREQTVFNLGEPSAKIEAISKMVSIYNGSGPPTVAFMPVVTSRELTVWNFPEPSAPLEAISKLVSVYNGSGPPTVAYLPVVVSREVTLFNLGEPTAPIEAISREVSVFAQAPINP